MTNIQDILGYFPKKSFSQEFEEKVKSIKGLNQQINDEAISQYKLELKKLFYFDDLIFLDLRNILEQFGEKSLTDRDISIIQNYGIGKIQLLLSFLNDNGINPTASEIYSVFQNFRNGVERDFLLNFSISTAGIQVSTGDKVIDIFTDKIEQVITDLRTRFNTQEEAGDSSILEKAQTIADILIQKKDEISEGLKIVHQLNEESQKNIQLNLDKHSKNFASKSSEFKGGYSNESFLIFDNILTNYIIKKEIKFISGFLSYFKNIRRNPSFSGRDIWLIYAILMGCIVLGIIFSFIEVIGTQKEISLGVAILRVSALIVPGYFGIFCIGEYTKAKRLYEKYQFKNIALETMNELLISYTDREERKEILSKGIDIIFSEPLEKEDASSLKGYIGDLKDIAKSRLSG